MYFFAIALTCIAFAAYVLFVVVYKSAKPAPKHAQHKAPTKRKPVNKKPAPAAQPTKAATTSSKPKKATKPEEQSAKPTKAEATKPVAKPKAKAQPQPKPKQVAALPQKTPSNDNLSDFEKLEAGDEDNIFEDGWEIIKRRKIVVAKKEAEDNDTSASETDDKAKTEVKSPREKRPKKDQREKGEGRRDRDRFDGDRKNRKGGDKPRFAPRIDQQVPAATAVAQPEKKKATPARDVRVGNYIFSRAPASAAAGARAGQETPFEALSRFVEEHGSHSDDTAPLKTAHLELRFYKEAAKPQKAKPGAVWEAMAKYNYTNKPPQAEDEKEEGEGEEESGTSEMPFAKEEELVDSFLRALGANFTKHLNKPHMEKGKPQRFLSQTDLETTKQDLLKLLLQGVSQEPPVCQNKEEASEFVDKVFGQFEQSSLRCFSHMGSRLWTRGFKDEGFFLFDNSRIGLFWFLGYD